MPLLYQQNIDDATRLGIWEITETEDFFKNKIILHRQISHPHKRLQHLAGRYLLNYLFPDFPSEEMLVADTLKPYLPNKQYYFSISHCGDYAAVIISKDKRVGIDIEFFTERVEKIKNKFLHPEEQELLNNATSKQLINQLTTFWCAKEAMFKWWEWGNIDFSEVLRIYDVPIQAEGLLNGCFIKEGLDIPLQLHYAWFKQITLVWLATDVDVIKAVD